MKTHAGWYSPSPEIASYAMPCALESSLKRTNAHPMRTFRDRLRALALHPLISGKLSRQKFPIGNKVRPQPVALTASV
ncbi:hypothetical protein G3N59_12180 [Paraburkholderia sp. Ac-20340]|uniref:hypothetical protein n=1 Tax=Paraburkholderia sp. Ac-20340 TaxID=2703888 RepID=UPI001980B921|nr:hypothetical protein [Paraburkholderia sp. Ac-20340]MBN3854140.1 hypothetical protein [Paraburkholderia sp. Ac-20340]